jgi:hypothetical protein
LKANNLIFFLPIFDRFNFFVDIFVNVFHSFGTCEFFGQIISDIRTNVAPPPRLKIDWVFRQQKSSTVVGQEALESVAHGSKFSLEQMIIV